MAVKKKKTTVKNGKKAAIRRPKKAVKKIAEPGFSQDVLHAIPAVPHAVIEPYQAPSRRTGKRICAGRRIRRPARI